MDKEKNDFKLHKKNQAKYVLGKDVDFQCTVFDLINLTYVSYIGKFQF